MRLPCRHSPSKFVTRFSNSAEPSDNSKLEEFYYTISRFHLLIVIP